MHSTLRTARLKLAAAAATGGLVLTLLLPGASAGPLDEQTCTQLKSEITLLEGMGVRDNLAKGAQWGKANLRSAQLEQVKKLIEIDEAVMFRCPRPKPAPAVVEPGAAPVEAKAKGKGKAVAKAKPEDPRPKARAKSPPADGQPAQKKAPGPGQQGQAEGQGQAQPRPKTAQPAPRAPDAHSPAVSQPPPLSGSAAGGAARP